MAPITINPDGIIRCYHNEPAKLFVSGTDKKSRTYGCPKPQSAQCGFFYNPSLQQQLNSRAQNESSHPTPSKRKRPEQSLATPPETEGKKRRFEDILAGLREREQDQADALPFTTGTSETQVSDTPTEPAQKERRLPRYSFLGLSPSQGSDTGAPSTPKKQAPPPLLYGLRAEPSSSALPTPRGTANRVQAQGSMSSRQEPVTPTQYKGKERVNAQWDSLPATDEENPFDETVKREQEGLESLGGSSTPTPGERVVNAISGVRRACLTFEDEMNRFDASSYILRMERQIRALEIKDKAKSKRIEDLEIQCDALMEKLRRQGDQ